MALGAEGSGGREVKTRPATHYQMIYEIMEMIDALMVMDNPDQDLVDRAFERLGKFYYAQRRPTYAIKGFSVRLPDDLRAK